MRAAALALAIGLICETPAVAQVAGDAARGERQFQRCFSCHSVDPAEKAKLQGPSLFGVVGRKAATVDGFDYSDAMRAAAAAGLVWDVPRLDAFIADAEAALPGTKMAMPPLRDAEDRADIIAYLMAAGRR